MPCLDIPALNLFEVTGKTMNTYPVKISSDQVEIRNEYLSSTNQKRCLLHEFGWYKKFTKNCCIITLRQRLHLLCDISEWFLFFTPQFRQIHHVGVFSATSPGIGPRIEPSTYYKMA